MAYQQTLLSLLAKLARLQVLESNTPTSHKRSCFVSAVASSFFWIKCISLTLFLPSLNLRAVRARRRKDRGSRECRAFVMSSKKRREWSFFEGDQSNYLERQESTFLSIVCEALFVWMCRFILQITRSKELMSVKGGCVYTDYHYLFPS